MKIHESHWYLVSASSGSTFQVVGSDRRVSLEDRASLPYTQAVLMESMRMASLVPAGLSHSVDQNLDFAGFTFPKVS